MRRFLALPLTITAIVVSLIFIASPAQAQAARTWVSGVGDDANPCSRTAPCKTFQGALSKTTVNGEINCLDPGGFGAVTITKSITIDCHEMVGAILSDGVAVSFEGFDPSDTLKTVNLRNLMIQGAGSNELDAIQISGTGQGSFVNIEDCLITGFPDAAGISDFRVRGALVINNTTVRNVGIVGIFITSPNDGSLRAVISNTRVINARIGISVGVDANVVLSHSVVSNNLTAGLQVASSGVLIVDSTTISHNGDGIQNSGTVRLSNSDLILNTVAISGSVNSFTNNRFSNNGTLGTIIPIGTTSNPTGQQ
jgi:hypothetical protein